MWGNCELWVTDLSRLSRCWLTVRTRDKMYFWKLLWALNFYLLPVKYGTMGSSGGGLVTPVAWDLFAVMYGGKRWQQGDGRSGGRGVTRTDWHKTRNCLTLLNSCLPFQQTPCSQGCFANTVLSDLLMHWFYTWFCNVATFKRDIWNFNIKLPSRSF